MIKWRAKPPRGFPLRPSVFSVVKPAVVFQGQINALAYNRSESPVTQRRQGAEGFVRSPAFRLGFGSARGSADYARELNIQYPMINIQ